MSIRLKCLHLNSERLKKETSRWTPTNWPSFTHGNNVVMTGRISDHDESDREAFG